MRHTLHTAAVQVAEPLGSVFCKAQCLVMSHTWSSLALWLMGNPWYTGPAPKESGAVAAGGAHAMLLGRPELPTAWQSTFDT